MLPAIAEFTGTFFFVLVIIVTTLCRMKYLKTWRDKIAWF